MAKVFQVRKITVDEGKLRQLGRRKDTLIFVRDNYLRRFLKGKVIPTLKQPGDYTDVRGVVLHFVEKSTKHLGAAILLCSQSYPEDALIIGRAIMELCFYTQYIAVSTTSAERDQRASNFIYDAERQRGTRRAALKALHAQGKCVEWVDDMDSIGEFVAPPDMPPGFVQPPTLKAIAEKLGGEWECQYNTLYWSVSKLAHPSALGAHSYVGDADIESEIGSSINLAFSMHARLMQAALFLLDNDSFSTALEGHMAKFIELANLETGFQS